MGIVFIITCYDGVFNHDAVYGVLYNINEHCTINVYSYDYDRVSNDISMYCNNCEFTIYSYVVFKICNKGKKEPLTATEKL